MRSSILAFFLLVVASLAIFGTKFLLADPPEKVPEVDPDKTLRNVPPNQGYQYFSGFVKNNHNHPAMYAHGSGANEKVVVVGHGCLEEFPMSKFDDAVKRYKALLEERGYHP